VSFLADTELRAVEADRYVATLTPKWTSMLGIHGGYLAAIAARAILTAVDEDRSLRGLDVQFVRPPAAGEIVIDVDVVNAGRSMTFARATVHQEHKLVLAAAAVAGSPRGGLEFDELPRPLNVGRGAPGNAERFTAPNPGQHFEQLEFRIEPELSLFGGSPVARVAGWMRPLDIDELVTIPWLVCAADFMPPSMVFRTDRPVKAASVDFCVQLLCSDPAVAVAPGEYIYGEMRSSISAEGFSVEDGTFWSPAGQLLATSRQLRLAGV
jgi:acyl-CoA thioesterase